MRMNNIVFKIGKLWQSSAYFIKDMHLTMLILFPDPTSGKLNIQTGSENSDIILGILDHSRWYGQLQLSPKELSGASGPIHPNAKFFPVMPFPTIGAPDRWKIGGKICCKSLPAVFYPRPGQSNPGHQVNTKMTAAYTSVWVYNKQTPLLI